jgi:hypothetical protein
VKFGNFKQGKNSRKITTANITALDNFGVLNDDEIIIIIIIIIIIKTATRTMASMAA